MKELRHLNKYFVKYKYLLFLGLCIAVISRILSLFMPRFIGESLNVVEEFLNEDSTLTAIIAKKQLLTNILIIVGAALASGFFTFLVRQTIINVSRHIEYDLKNEIYAHYQKLDLDFYKKNSTGDLMNRINEDVSKVRMYFGPGFMYTINTVTLFIIVISYMLSIHRELTLYAIIPLPILSVLIFFISKKMHHKTTLIQETLSKLSTFCQDKFSGISIIKSHAIEHRINKFFFKLSGESFQRNVDFTKIQAWFFPLMILLIGISNLLVIFIGGSLYINGKIEIGVLAQFIIYINMLTWPVAVLGWVTSIVQQAEASQKRINEFLLQKPILKKNKGKKQKITGAICFDNVGYTYPESKINALKNISFEIEAGKTLGIIGKTGSGKTTILDLICRLYDNDTGSIKIDNCPIIDYDLYTLRSAIGYVPQNPFLFSDTIERNIRFGDENASFETIKSVAKHADIDQNIEKFKNKYQTVLGERGVTLSGGQVQRLSIARAFIKKSNILLLDDCLSAVDSKTEEKILQNIKKYYSQQTSIIISHRISSIKHADHIIVLKDGEIEEQGDHKMLLKKEGYYKNLFLKQQKK